MSEVSDLNTSRSRREQKGSAPPGEEVPEKKKELCAVIIKPEQDGTFHTQ